jgi:hypothetical protein
MTGDHHGRNAGRASLPVRAVDALLGTHSLQIACEELDVGAAGLEQAELVLLAPTGELPQVQLIRLTRQTAVSGEEPG